ncbi:hypothetical protein [Vibrio cortegadensis]|uniref:Uncharacterized protein n=1 Tax=Vibrio cortegadensis TaxID=1328770 RepID=A0ABV4M3R4_9VIBR
MQVSGNHYNSASVGGAFKSNNSNQYAIGNQVKINSAANYIDQAISANAKNIETKVENQYSGKVISVKDTESGVVLKRIKASDVLSTMNQNTFKGNFLNQRV